MADALSPQALSGLIGSIYDCALDPSRWEQTLADIGDALDCYGLILGLSDLRHDRLLIHKAVGVESDHIERLSKHLSEIDAILAEALASWPSLDEPWVPSRHLTNADIETSPYFQECKAAGIVDMMQFFLVHEPMHFSGLGVGRHERQGLITDREIEVGRLLLPHLRRALTISKVLDVRTIEVARMAETLDALRCAVVLTNEHGTILHANRVWRSASPSPMYRPSSLTSCRSPEAISAPGCSPRPLPPCSSVRHRTRRMVQMPWLPPLA